MPFCILFLSTALVQKLVSAALTRDADVELKRTLATFLASVAKDVPPLFSALGQTLFESTYVLLNDPDAFVRRSACEAVFHLAPPAQDRAAELPACEVSSMKLLFSLMPAELRDECLLKWWFSLGDDAGEVDETALDGSNPEDGYLNFSTHTDLLYQAMLSFVTPNVEDVNSCICVPGWLKECEIVSLDCLKRALNNHSKLVNECPPLGDVDEYCLLLKRLYVLAGIFNLLKQPFSLPEDWAKVSVRQLWFHRRIAEFSRPSVS
jgi:hypothetical protein